jgi:membrane protein DedA with SNARE-associated domain
MRPCARPEAAILSDLHEALGVVAPYLDRYGYAAVVGALLLESLGLPLPGETTLIAGAALAVAGDLQLAPLLICAWLAAVAGDNLGFAIGRFGGRRLILRYGARIGVTEDRFAWVEAFFHRFGGAVVLVARFFVVVRQLNGLVAGTVGMGWWRFLACNAIGAALWVGAWGFGVYYFGQTLGDVAARLHGAGYALGIAALVAIVGCVVVHGWRHRAGVSGVAPGWPRASDRR